MDRSSLPATNDPHIHNETRDHTAVYEQAAIKCKVPSFYNIFLVACLVYVLGFKEKPRARRSNQSQTAGLQQDSSTRLKVSNIAIHKANFKIKTITKFSNVIGYQQLALEH